MLKYHHDAADPHEDLLIQLGIQIVSKKREKDQQIKIIPLSNTADPSPCLVVIRSDFRVNVLRCMLAADAVSVRIVDTTPIRVPDRVRTEHTTLSFSSESRIICIESDSQIIAHRRTKMGILLAEEFHLPRLISLAMAFHGRIGKTSSLGVFDEEIIRMIAFFTHPN